MISYFLKLSKKIPTSIIANTKKEIKLCARKYSSRNKPKENSVFRSIWTYFVLFGWTSASTYLFYKLILNEAKNKNNIEIVSNDIKESDHEYQIENLENFQENFNIQLPSNLAKDDPESARNKYNFVNNVVKKCAPAVFHIQITNPKSKTGEDNEITPFVYGSGFVIREDGWALTNAHVVLNKESIILCKMHDDNIYEAKIIDIDVNVDVALLKISTDKALTAIPFEDAGEVTVGEWVVALGSPLSLSNSVSVGVISSLNRPARDLGLKNYSMSYIQTDALITFGNSGGPLVNLDGKAVGISSLRLTSGIAFAIPIEYCLNFVKKCRSFNPSVSLQDLNKEDIKLFGLTTISITSDLVIDLLKNKINVPNDFCEGLLVWKVLAGSVADKSGIKAGNIITHINGVPVRKPLDIYNLFKKNSVKCIIIQDDKINEISIRKMEDNNEKKKKLHNDGLNYNKSGNEKKND